jgi:ABC-2 type transport system permease protein
MTYTSAISLSLEGKNLWILKSLPIKAETIMFSKILFNILLVLPISIFAILMFGISIQIGFVNQILLIVLASAFSILTSTVDGIVNLYMPKFNYTNDVEVIKQSAGALLGVFGGFGLMALNGLGFYLLSGEISMSLILLLMGILNALLSVFAIWVIKSQSEKVFRTYKA